MAILITENKTYTSQMYAEDWLTKNVQLAAESKLKLSGEESLYSKYIESCEGREDPPLTARVLVRKLEMLLALRENHMLQRIRTSRGIYLQGLAIGTDGMKRK